MTTHVNAAGTNPLAGLGKMGCGLLGCGGLLLLALIIGGWMVGIYNNMVKEQETVETAWAQVENVYQRRMDLVPQLVETVRGAKEGEIEALERVMKARAEATSVKIDASNLDEASLKKFQDAQGQLGMALSRLMAVSEAYPDIKFNENFKTLQAQLEGTENRIAVERQKFNETAKTYNTYIRTFPNSLLAGLFGFDRKPLFQAQAGADQAPKIDFSSKSGGNNQ